MKTGEFVYFLIRATEKEEVHWQSIGKDFFCEVKLRNIRLQVTIWEAPTPAKIMVERKGREPKKTTYRAAELYKLVETIHESREGSRGLDELIKDL